MLLAGDELGRTQHGNNNGYLLDDGSAWLDWDARRPRPPRLGPRRHRPAPPPPAAATRRVARPGEPLSPDGRPDVTWRRTRRLDPPTRTDWHDPDARTVVVDLVGETDLEGNADELVLVIHAVPETDAVALPDGTWHPVLDSGVNRPSPVPSPPVSGRLDVGPWSFIVLVPEHPA